MLDPFSRGAIVALSALCVAAAIEFAPLPARSLLEETGLLPPPMVAMNAQADAVERIERDPFAEPVPSAPPLAQAGPGQSRPPGSAALDVLPNNLASDSIPALPGEPTNAGSSAPHITAIVTGAHPYALVESGGVHEIKGIGDRVAGIGIAAIDISGIRLQNGRRLNVDSTTQP